MSELPASSIKSTSSKMGDFNSCKHSLLLHTHTKKPSMKLIFKADRPRTAWGACSCLLWNGTFQSTGRDTSRHRICSGLQTQRRNWLLHSHWTAVTSENKAACGLSQMQSKCLSKTRSKTKKKGWLQLRPAVLLPSRRGLHWAPVPRKELSVELGHNTWFYLSMRTRLILFLSINAIKTNFL